MGWWSRLWRPTAIRANAECPICGQPVVAAPTSRWSPHLGPMAAQRTKEELVAACSLHGRPPFNDLTTRAQGGAG